LWPACLEDSSHHFGLGLRCPRGALKVLLLSYSMSLRIVHRISDDFEDRAAVDGMRQWDNSARLTDCEGVARGFDRHHFDHIPPK
jgi:hypothetical protein